MTTSWTYARLTGNKGETGTSFIPLYSASNIPYLDNPANWSETYDPEHHIYMCVKTITTSGTTYSSPSRFVGENGTSITILDSYDTYEQLVAAHPTGNEGDGYLVNGDLWVWLKGATSWKNVGNIKGPQGTSIHIVDTKIQYQLCSSGSSPDEQGWVDDIPILEQGYYLWTKTYVLYSDSTSTIAYSVAYIGTDANTAVYSMRIDPTSVTFSETGKTISGEKLVVRKIRTDNNESYPTDYGYITVQEDNEEEQEYGVSELDTSGVYDSTKVYAAKYKPFLLKIGTDAAGNDIVLGMSNEVAMLFFEREKEEARVRRN